MSMVSNESSVPHRGWEWDLEYGGMICSECGWSFGGFDPTDPGNNPTQRVREHDEHVQAMAAQQSVSGEPS